MTSQDIKYELNELNAKYSNGSLNVSHKEYLKMFNKIKNQNSLTNQIKEFGSKVKREFAGYYIYEGVNFTANFNEEECEIKYWSVAIYGNNVDEIVCEEFEEYNRFDRKADVLNMLFQLDKRLSENK